MNSRTFVWLAGAIATCAAGCSSTSTATDGSVDDTAADIAIDDASNDATNPIDVGTPTDTNTMTDASSDGFSGSDGSILPPVDAGNPFGDSGALGDPAWVPVDVRTTTTCDAFTPCGGDVLGTWDVTGACVEVPLSGLLSACPTAMVTRADGMARGRVTFGPIIAVRTAQSQVEVDLAIPAVCANAAGGCAALQGALRGANPDSACVTTSTGDCNCAMRQVTTINDADGYTIQGNDIVSATLGRRWSYCIMGTSLVYQDTTPGTAHEPGIITLGMR